MVRQNILRRWAVVVGVTALACAAAPVAKPVDPARSVASHPTSSVPAASSPAVPSASAARTSATRLERYVGAVESMVRLIAAGDVDGVSKRMNAAFKIAVPPPQLRAFVERMKEAGPIEAVELVRYSAEDRVAVFSLRQAGATLELRVALDDDDLFSLFGVRTPRPRPPLERNPELLALPVRGEWRVAHGGATIEENHHVNVLDQRRAADLVKTDADGKTHRGTGKANGDYFAYGEPLYAVLDGVVESVVDGVADNVPGEQNPYDAFGNRIVLEHAAMLYSVYAHLQPGSVRWRPGQRVKQGQKLGACGNSGNSSEPHLHFQLQDAEQPHQARGMEAVFGGVSLRRDGVVTQPSSYTFLRGDVISMLVTPAAAR